MNLKIEFYCFDVIMNLIFFFLWRFFKSEPENCQWIQFTQWILCIHSTLRLQLAQPYFWAHVIIVLIGVDGNVYYPNVQWCHFFAIGDKKRFVCHIMQLIYLFAFSDTKVCLIHFICIFIFSKIRAS